MSIAYQFVELVPWIWLKASRERGVYRVIFSTDVGMCKRFQGENSHILHLALTPHPAPRTPRPPPRLGGKEMGQQNSFWLAFEEFFLRVASSHPCRACLLKRKKTPTQGRDGMSLSKRKKENRQPRSLSAVRERAKLSFCASKEGRPSVGVEEVASAWSVSEVVQLLTWGRPSEWSVFDRWCRVLRWRQATPYRNAIQRATCSAHHHRPQRLCGGCRA